MEEKYVNPVSEWEINTWIDRIRSMEFWVVTGENRWRMVAALEELKELRAGDREIGVGANGEGEIGPNGTEY
jgi:hypothetical protein